VRRRTFITLLGGAAAWPVAAQAQQLGGIRRIGVLMPVAADAPEAVARLAAFVHGLQQLGWTDGRNVRIEARWATDPDQLRRHAAELVALAPDVILAAGGTAVGPLLQATRTLPIVFTLTLDPVGAGYVDSLAQPGRNATGFTAYEYGLSAKWLELLKEIAPRVTRVAVLRDATLPQGVGQFVYSPWHHRSAWSCARSTPVIPAWLAFAGRASNPLDRCKRFQIIHPPFLDFAWRKGSFIATSHSTWC
jgi:putative ABC transport system substrate-binding protein